MESLYLALKLMFATLLDQIHLYAPMPIRFWLNPNGVWQLTRDPEASTRAHLFSGGNLSNIVAITSVAAIVNALNAGTSMILSYNGYSVPVCFSSHPQGGNVTINGITCEGSYKLDAPGSGTINTQESNVAHRNQR